MTGLAESDHRFRVYTSAGDDLLCKLLDCPAMTGHTTKTVVGEYSAR